MTVTTVTWRKKWERVWDEVTTCSKRCNSERRRQARVARKQLGTKGEISKNLTTQVDELPKSIEQYSVDNSKAARRARKKELKAMQGRHEKNIGCAQSWVDIAPAMGMIGTLVGLVAMLGNMADPKAIGPAMAVALLTTLYGAMIANTIFMPIVIKLKGYSAYETTYREMIITGLQFISRGESPRNIQDQLVANLPPKEKQKLLEAAAGG